MYRYHETSEQIKRFEEGRCRCGSNGQFYSLVTLVHDGRILSPTDMVTPLTTPMVRNSRTDLNPPGAGYGKTFIFAISEKLEIHIAPDSNRNLPDAVKHETLFHNANVLAAGEISIQEGIVTGLNDHSGSYNTFGGLETNPGFVEAILNAFKNNGVPVAPILVERLQNITAS